MTDAAHNRPDLSGPEPRFLLLGEILRPHGIRGELRMRVLTDYPERIPELDQVYLADSIDSSAPESYHVTNMRMHQGYALLTLDGIADRSQADTLRELKVMVAIEDAIPLEEGEFYLYQLFGLRVETIDGLNLGIIKDVLETGANDVYVLDSPQHGEILIPVTEETIVSTDITAGCVVVRLPEGLLPEN
jgi:16S rRNA processing protein RimM